MDFKLILTVMGLQIFLLIDVSLNLTDIREHPYMPELGANHRSFSLGGIN